MNFKIIVADFFSGKNTKLSFLTILGVTLLLFFFGFGIGRCSKAPSESPAQIDTVLVDRPCPKVFVEDVDVSIKKALPAVTIFKVTDWVCAWDRWSGVITGISWSEKNPNVLLYEVLYLNEEEEWVNNSYYETELQAGKCH